MLPLISTNWKYKYNLHVFINGEGRAAKTCAEYTKTKLNSHPSMNPNISNFENNDNLC